MKNFASFLLVALCPVTAQASPCASLKELLIPNVAITSAVESEAGAFPIPDTKMTKMVPRSCRVAAVATPTSDSVIHIEIWLPEPRAWNGKFQGVGNGAYIGEINYGGMATAIARGYATASTDTGHTGSDLKFAAGHPEKIVDWGYRAVHVMTETAKLVTRAYEGAFPRRSYFSGCSTGGHQGLSEAQRFPADYDGIISGDPGNDRTHLNAGFLWAFKAVHEKPGSFLTPDKLKLLTKAALEACDELDGVRDGIIADPRKCHFDPGAVMCRSSHAADCLTPDQVEAARKIYQGPRNPRTGEQIIAGYAIGSENPATDEYHGWQGYITGVSEPKRNDFWKYWVFNDPSWDWRTFDFDRDLAYADSKVAAVNASNPDLHEFARRGGRILMYSGWADPVGPPQDAIDYYEKVVRATGGLDQTQSFFRLFMVPGMGHCEGGVGPNLFGPARSVPSTVPPALLAMDPQHDALSALDGWVETGMAPEHIIALHYDGTKIDRTRPVCPYPQVARWKGAGSTDDAANFVCVAEP